MKKIIDGKRYNTATAEKVGDYCNGFSNSDFNYISETLYRTKSGAYFIYGCGGAMTQYAEFCGNGSVSGSDIIRPFSVREAFAWAQCFLSADKVEAEFESLISEA